MPERHFVKYTFLKLDPAWRRLDDAERARHKREFLAACEDFAPTGCCARSRWSGRAATPT